MINDHIIVLFVIFVIPHNSLPSSSEYEYKCKVWGRGRRIIAEFFLPSRKNIFYGVDGWIHCLLELNVGPVFTAYVQRRC